MLAKATLIKSADNADSKSYEVAFSNIAHQYVQDRAPKLAEFEVGFQLLDKSEEGDKAVGVFGYKAGPNWFYAPVFYLSGKVKGGDMLFIKHENIIVPLRENWVNHLLSKRPSILGSSIDRRSRQFGVTSPDLSHLSRSPTKYGSVRPGFDHELHCSLAKIACDTETINAGFKNMDLGVFLKSANLQIVQKFVDICREFPKVAQAFDHWHGIPVLEDAVKLARGRERTGQINIGLFAPTTLSMDDILGTKQADEKPNNGSHKGLRILSPQNIDQQIVPEELDQERLERMIKKKILIEDDRVESEMSRLYTAESTKTLTNPTTSGVYDVLLKEGEFAKCLVLLSPTDGDTDSAFATVIELGDDPSYTNAKPKDVWVGNADGKFAYGDWFKDLPDQSIDNRDWYVAIGANGDATLPFSREHDYETREDFPPQTTKDGTKIYRIDVDNHGSCRYDRPMAISRTTDDNNSYDRYRDGARLHIGSVRGSKIVAFRGDIYIPDSFKIVKAKTRPTSRYDSDSAEVAPSPTRRYEPIELGNLASTYFHLMGKQANFELGTREDADAAVVRHTASLDLYTSHRTVHVNNQQFTDKTAALIHLVRDYGLREKQAEELLQASRDSQKCLVRYRIKYAEIMPRMQTAPTIPEDSMSQGSEVNPDQQAMYAQTYGVPIPNLQADQGNRQLYNPNTNFDPGAGGIGGGAAYTPSSGGRSSLSDGDAGDLASAVNSGQKEVFDTSAISTLLKSVSDESIIDRYLGPVIGGVDALGRLRFQYYWHGDEFAERYGKQDMPELEDALRNAFEQSGDVALRLRQKAVNAQGDSAAGIDLSHSSSGTNGM